MSNRLALLALVAGVLVGATACSGDPSDGDLGDDSPDDPTGRTSDPLLAGRRVPIAELRRDLAAAGFSSSVIGKMVCTAKYESSFYERATNRNTNGSTDYGVWQINSIHLGEANCPSAGALFSAAQNAKCAHTIYRQQGLNAWYGYRAHRTECNAAP